MCIRDSLSAVAIPEKLGRGRTGKIKITLDTEKLPKLGLTTASVYLSDVYKRQGNICPTESRSLTGEQIQIDTFIQL